MKRKLLILLSICITFLTPDLTKAQSSCTDTPAILSIPSSYLGGYTVTVAERTATLATETDWYDLTNSLPAGYDITGNTNYKSYLQNGINTHKHVKMPDFPILIAVPNDNTSNSGRGLYFQDSSKVYFPPNSKLILKSTAAADYRILQIYNNNNVVIYYANIQGDKYNHASSSGESGMGISIKSSNSISLIKPKVVKCWGDGIYIGRISSATAYCSDTYISNAIVDDNRRNGLTVVSADHLTVDGIISSNAQGAAPSVGIDMEPNQPNERLTNIIINNPVTYNNKSTGISFYPEHLLDTNGITQNVSIAINNHIDNLSCQAIGITTSFTNKPAILGGNITFNKPDWKNPRSGTYAKITDNANENQCIVTMNWGCRPPINTNTCDLSVTVHSQLASQYNPSPIPNWIITNCGIGTSFSDSSYLCTGSTCKKVTCRSFSASESSQADLKNYYTDKIMEPIFSVSPNPFSDVLNLSFQDNQNENAMVSIYDISGKLIKSQKIKSPSESIDTYNISKGMYLLKVVNGQYSKTIKITKQ